MKANSNPWTSATKLAILNAAKQTVKELMEVWSFHCSSEQECPRRREQDCCGRQQICGDDPEDV